VSEEAKAAVRRIFDAVNEGKLDAVENLISDSYVNHNFPGPEPGPAGFRAAIEAFRAAFPDLRVSVDQVIAEGDKVSSQGTWTGTHKGEFMGIAPTGRLVKVNYIDIWRQENGRFVENWVQMDLSGLMLQLGVQPVQG
jgi:steroid delta-isomerase-like uncharacterized protein